MMSSTNADASSSTAEKAKREKGKGILCAKCEHLNLHGSSTCKRCGSHLYISCVDCGHRNERVRSRCADCGRRLHRGFFQRLASKTIGRAAGLSPLQIFLFLLGVGIVFGVIVLFSNLRLPALF